MDRNEEDHLGNLRELERLIASLGLKLETVWLSGRPWAELRRAARSATLLALPLGRAAARRIAASSGARVVEVDTPFGPGRSAELLRRLAQATGRSAAAEALIEAELRARATRLEWIVPHLLSGKRVACVAPPDLLGGFAELASELGMVVELLGSPAARPAWLDDETLGRWPPECPHPMFDAEVAAASRHLTDHDCPVDLAVAHSEVLRHLPAGIARVELGYPSYDDHALFDRPYLGFAGWLCFVQRMATALSMTPRRA
jgi:nitrogenase molybdenum-iron protein alpha/beta subunit